MNYKGYKELECYKEGRLLRILISGFAKKLPSSEKFLLCSQMLDASRSVTANIAESYGRYTYADTRNFFIISRGSATEIMEHLSTAFDEGYISEDELQVGETKCELIIKLINGYIGYLDKSRQQVKQQPKT